MLASTLRLALSAAALLLAAAPLRADTLKVPADFGTIQQAVDAANTGDVVQVSKGVYAENVFITTAGITLKGKGAVIDGRFLGNCVIATASDVTIESLTLINGAGEPPGDGGTTGGLRAVGTGITLSKITVLASGTFGILLEGTGTVTQCTVDICHGDGIDVLTGDIISDPVTVISKNKVTRADAGIFASGGVFTIEKNTCENNVEVGMQLVVPEGPLDGTVGGPTTISKNTLRDNGNFGLIVRSLPAESPGVLVQKNTIERHGIGCQFEGFGIEADGNTVQDNREDGIVVLASNSTLVKNKVRSNGRVGIFVGAAETVLDASSAGFNTLDQNTVQDNGGDGLQIISTDNTIDRTNVADNGGDGIQIDVAADNHLHDNKVMGNAHDGIDNSGLGTMLTDNQCKDNGGADLAGAGSGPGTVNAKQSGGNTVSDDSDLLEFTTLGELDLPL